MLRGYKSYSSSDFPAGDDLGSRTQCLDLSLQIFMSAFAERDTKHPCLQGPEVMDCFAYMSCLKHTAESVSIRSALDLKVPAFSHWTNVFSVLGTRRLEIELEKQVAEQKDCIDQTSKSTANSRLHSKSLGLTAQTSHHLLGFVNKCGFYTEMCKQKHVEILGKFQDSEIWHRIGV